MLCIPHGHQIEQKLLVQWVVVVKRADLHLSINDVATNSYVDLKVSGAVTDLKAYLADREARMTLNLMIWLGIVLSAIGVATAVLIAVLG